MKPDADGLDEVPSTHINDVLAATRRVRRVARVNTRGDLVAEIQRLQHDLSNAKRDDGRLNRVAEAPAIQARIDELHAEAQASEAEFVFEAIGQKAWSDLLKQHPPSREHRDQGAEFDPETFPPAAVAASCVSPEGMTLEAAQAMWGKWNWTQLQMIWAACIAANLGGDSVPLPNSTTAAPAASLAASTSDGS